MDFSLNEEQLILKDSVAKYLANNYDFTERQAIRDEVDGFSRKHWQQFAELGWLTIPFSETHGGFGGKIEDTAVLMEEFGRGLVLEPYLASVLLAGQLIARSGNEHAITECLGAIMEGNHTSALAAYERQSRQNPFDVKTAATVDGDRIVVSGEKTLVLNGAAADSLAVTARTDGDQFDQTGLSLLLIDTTSDGITRGVIPMMDGTKAANIVFDKVTVSANALLGERGNAMKILTPVIQEARIATSAQALGIADELVSKTVEYAKTREQFGTSIGRFQALQHRMVDMFMAAEQCRSMVYRAICEYQQGDPGAPATIAAMKALVGRYAHKIGTEAIQIHGGMGMTDELDIGHYVKSGMMLNQIFGHPDACTREFCELSYGS